MTADVLPFKHPRKGECDGRCKTTYIKALASNKPAYCSYECGAAAQPKHTARAVFSGDRKK